MKPPLPSPGPPSKGSTHTPAGLDPNDGVTTVVAMEVEEEPDPAEEAASVLVDRAQARVSISGDIPKLLDGIQQHITSSMSALVLL